jgi:predicted kinase
MLCGLPASGKSTYAQKLMKKGLIKLSPDEEVYKRFGHAGTDYPAQEYLQNYTIVLTELEKELLKLLKQKKAFVLDYGYWRRDHREKHKQVIENYGAKWKLLYFKASTELIAERIEQRNKRTDANAFPITKDMLRNFIERFEEPRNEGEEIIQTLTHMPKLPL